MPQQEQHSKLKKGQDLASSLVGYEFSLCAECALKVAISCRFWVWCAVRNAKACVGTNFAVRRAEPKPAEVPIFEDNQVCTALHYRGMLSID